MTVINFIYQTNIHPYPNKIDAELAENQQPKQELDDTEFIEVLRVPLDNLLAHLTGA